MTAEEMAFKLKLRQVEKNRKGSVITTEISEKLREAAARKRAAEQALLKPVDKTIKKHGQKGADIGDCVTVLFDGEETPEIFKLSGKEGEKGTLFVKAALGKALFGADAGKEFRYEVEGEVSSGKIIDIQKC